MPTRGSDFPVRSAVAHGGVVVAGISQSHRPEVNVIFGYLIGVMPRLFGWQLTWYL